MRAAATTLAAQVASYAVAQNATVVDFDIEEDYTTATKPGMPWATWAPNGRLLLSDPNGQRFYAYFLYAMGKAARAKKLTFTLDIQEPFLATPFRALDVSSTCAGNPSSCPATCAAWMPVTWSESAGAMCKGGTPF